MKTAEEIRRANARELAKSVGGNAAFSDRIERSTTQVSRFMGKKATTKIGPRMARHIEKCFGKPEGWLDIDHSVPRTKIVDLFGGHGEILTSPIPDKQKLYLRHVPLISEVQAGNWSAIEAKSFIDEDTEWQITASNVSEDAFALRVSGNSMTNPFGSPSIPAGSIVIVEPCHSPENGKIVVATLNDSPEATIKKLEIDGPHRFLVPLNPKYDPIPINGNCRIVGYVKQVIMDL
ncbi:LexA family protein [Vibrio cholerae]|uniref:LexA family protein n=1 Tax=Vibrio cholerae TaxID=666 RepID=UPI0028DE3E79|nr:S24 family peptidase [Vibrio cholerae]MDV2325486.1 S24 family peptidase [Vibrio cholerae]HDZ9677846.1 LexA family transcriptional repressor [Vibrio cholerae]